MPRLLAITGSTRGIGLAIAQAFVEAGDRVVLHYRANEEVALAARDQLEGLAEGSVAGLIQADLATIEGTEYYCAVMERDHRTLDGLVCNAGPFALANWAVHDPLEIRRLFHVNVFAHWTICQRLIPYLRLSSGVITVIGQNGVQELRAAPRWAAYNAAKAALIVLARTIAQSEGQSGVRCNVVNPGIIDTGHYSSEFLARISEQIGLKRVGTPGEIAHCVHWLHSEKASYVSGAVIDLSGGYVP